MAVTQDNAAYRHGLDRMGLRGYGTPATVSNYAFKGHTRAVRTVAVTPDGTRIVTGSDDGTIRVWDAVTGVETLEKSTARPV